MREKKLAVSASGVGAYLEGLLDVHQDPQLTFALEQAQKKGTPPLQMTPLDARHLEVLARSIQPKKIVEIGTLCGYSTICLSKALAENGKIYTCERSEHHAAVAKETFERLGLQEKIQIVFGEALESLKTIENEGPFDLIFIDADKENYPNYFDWAIANLRVGGMLIADNVFAFERIADNPLPEGKLGDIVSALRLFNEKCAKNKSLVTTFFPTGEGLSVSVKVTN